MLLQTGRQIEIEGLRMLLGHDRFNNSNKYYQVNNREFFKTIDSENKFFGELAMFPYKSFAFIYLRPVDFINRQFLMKARQLSTKGIIFNFSSIPNEMERLLFKFSEIKRANKSYDDIKAVNDERESKYKKEKKEVKGRNTIVREANKELEKAWKKAKKELKKGFDETMDGMSDAQKEFMPKEPTYDPEPEYQELETVPPEPRYRDLPRSVSIHIGENQLHKTFSVAWNMLSAFEFYQIEGTEHGILLKRDEPLKYTYDNLNLLSISKKMSKDEFLNLFDKFERNEKVLETYRPAVSINYNFLDLRAENNNTFEGSQWIYSEGSKLDEDEEALPSLAPIKSMHAASILSAGMKFSKEIKTPEGYLLIKSAPVKIFTEKQKIVNGKKITEVYQQNETKLAFYNLDTRSLEVY